MHWIILAHTICAVIVWLWASRDFYAKENADLLEIIELQAEELREYRGEDVTLAPLRNIWEQPGTYDFERQ